MPDSPSRRMFVASSWESFKHVVSDLAHGLGFSHDSPLFEFQHGQRIQLALDFFLSFASLVQMFVQRVEVGNVPFVGHHQKTSSPLSLKAGSSRDQELSAPYLGHFE